MAVSVSHGPFIPLCAAITGARVRFWQPLVFARGSDNRADLRRIFGSLFPFFYVLLLSPLEEGFFRLIYLSVVRWGCYGRSPAARLTPGNVRFS